MKRYNNGNAYNTFDNLFDEKDRTPGLAEKFATTRAKHNSKYNTTLTGFGNAAAGALYQNDQPLFVRRAMSERPPGLENISYGDPAGHSERVLYLKLLSKVPQNLYQQASLERPPIFDVNKPFSTKNIKGNYTELGEALNWLKDKNNVPKINKMLKENNYNINMLSERDACNYGGSMTSPYCNKFLNDVSTPNSKFGYLAKNEAGSTQQKADNLKNKYNFNNSRFKYEAGKFKQFSPGYPTQQMMPTQNEQQKILNQYPSPNKYSQDSVFGNLNSQDWRDLLPNSQQSLVPIQNQSSKTRLGTNPKEAEDKEFYDALNNFQFNDSSDNQKSENQLQNIKRRKLNDQSLNNEDNEIINLSHSMFPYPSFNKQQEFDSQEQQPLNSKKRKFNEISDKKNEQQNTNLRNIISPPPSGNNTQNLRDIISSTNNSNRPNLRDIISQHSVQQQSTNQPFGYQQRTQNNLKQSNLNNFFNKKTNDKPMVIQSSSNQQFQPISGGGTLNQQRPAMNIGVGNFGSTQQNPSYQLLNQNVGQQQIGQTQPNLNVQQQLANSNPNYRQTFNPSTMQPTLQQPQHLARGGRVTTNHATESRRHLDNLRMIREYLDQIYQTEPLNRSEHYKLPKPSKNFTKNDHASDRQQYLNNLRKLREYLTRI